MGEAGTTIQRYTLHAFFLQNDCQETETLMAPDEPHEPAQPASVETFLAEAIESKRRFEEFIASSTAALNQLIEKARNDGAEVEALKTTVAALKGGIESTHGAAASELGNITQAKSEVETLKSGAIALSKRVNKRFEDVDGKFAALEFQEASLQSILAELAAIKAEAESERDAVKATVTEMEGVSAAFDALKTQAFDRQAELDQSQGALKSGIDAINDAHTKIVELRTLLLEGSDDTESVEDQIVELHKQITETLADVVSKRDAAQQDFSTFRADVLVEKNALFKALEEKILMLLPSAGAAGLAYTYYDAKSKYSPTSYAGRPGGVALTGFLKFLRSVFSYNPSSLLATLIFYAMFFIPLVLLAMGSYELLRQIELDPDFVLTWELLALRILVAVPLAAISAFGFASLRLYRALYEEYNHKQRVMELYESFKQEISEHGGEDQKKLLLDVMINSVANKPLDLAKDLEVKNGHATAEEKAFSRIEKVLELVGKAKAAV